MTAREKNNFQKENKYETYINQSHFVKSIYKEMDAKEKYIFRLFNLFFISFEQSFFKVYSFITLILNFHF